MQKLGEHINNLLYNQREKVLGLVRIASGIMVVLGVGLLVYRYGFLPAEENMQQILFFFDVLFAANLFFFVIRWLLALEKKTFIIKSWFESTLNLIIFIHG